MVATEAFFPKDRTSEFSKVYKNDISKYTKQKYKRLCKIYTDLENVIIEALVPNQRFYD